MPMLSVTVIVRPPDFARTASDYARHRAGFPPELLDRLATIGVAHELAAMLAERYPENPLTIPHRVWAVTA